MTFNFLRPVQSQTVFSICKEFCEEVAAILGDRDVFGQVEKVLWKITSEVAKVKAITRSDLVVCNFADNCLEGVVWEREFAA